MAAVAALLALAGVYVITASTPVDDRPAQTQHLTLRAYRASPPASAAVVRLEAQVSQQAQDGSWRLYMCGIPQAAATRSIIVSLPGPGTYKLRSSLRGGPGDAEQASATTTVSVAEDPEASAALELRLRRVQESAGAPAGAEVLRLIETRDLTIADTLWAVIRSAPRDSPLRSLAVGGLADMRHLDSFLGLVDLFGDSSLRLKAYVHLESAFMTFGALPMPLENMNKDELERCVSEWKAWFAENEARLRRNLHQ